MNDPLKKPEGFTSEKIRLTAVPFLKDVKKLINVVSLGRNKNYPNCSLPGYDEIPLKFKQFFCAL